MVEGRYAGSLSRAWEKLRRKVADFGDLSIPMRAAGIGAVLLGLGTLMPWYDYGSHSARGVESNAGLLMMASAIATLVVLAPLYRARSRSAPGVLAALALFALVLLASDLIEMNRENGFFADTSFSPEFGFWVSAAGGVLLMMAALNLWGGPNPVVDRDPD